MAKNTETAITPRRAENYPEWYQQVVRAAELAEVSCVRGCMVIKPWGYGIWECMQRALDQMIKDTGHENAYFPLFIPISFMEREAAHVEGFAKECAVVTHHRLELKEGRLVPTGELEEPLIVRPTSETIIGQTFSKWVQSYRDLPLLINQWANVVRWEMRTRLLLRTVEFLWQEGHTAHATHEEAQSETMQMLEVYRDFCERFLAIPVVVGRKTEGERFPGALETFSLEAMMQDRKALQAGTSHYLGQNFAKACDIKFLNQAGEIEYAYTTSWGVSTRLIGAMVMTHGDDNGMRVPPRVAPKHIAILPVLTKEGESERVLAYAEKIASMLKGQIYYDRPLVSVVDKRDLRGGEKTWQWIKRGIPLRLEVGPRDIESGQVVVYRRDEEPRQKIFMKLEEFVAKVPQLLDEIHTSYFDTALKFKEANTHREIGTYEDLKAFFEDERLGGGFVLAKWCEDAEVEETLKELKITIRCMPLEQSNTSGKCVVTGRDAVKDAIFAKAY
ncbi:MAG: proline--tRNA ligase [Deltaproteobacteria bacterium]|nr:proline--tRNA ligase [Deltaproteobacteria bacterium]